MAKGGKDEHRMLFDIRGRRKNVVKVVYGILALLMALSLLLVVGPAPLADIFGLEDEASNAAEQFEEQAERIEVKLAKEPDNPDLYANLMRARITAANSEIEVNPTTGETSVSIEARQQLEQASAAWSDYLKATGEPSAGAAQLIVPSLVLLAETSRVPQQGEANIAAAAEAQEIVATQRPSVNSLTSLALYTLFTFDYAAAEKIQKEAEALATPAQRKEIDTRLSQTRKAAEEFEKQGKEAKKLEEEAPASGEQAPGNSLGGAIGGGGTLSE